MSATPLRNLILAATVIGFSTVALATGHFETIVARAVSAFATAQIDNEAQAPGYVVNNPYGMWSFEFE